jgi:hypothetical protein
MPLADHILLSLLARPGAWLDSASVGVRVDPSASDPKAAASLARREERIFALWDGERFHYPTFQFEIEDGPRASTGRLIQVLPRDRNGLVGTDAVLWVFSPDDALGGHTPAEVFPLDPERVIALAHARKHGDGE